MSILILVVCMSFIMLSLHFDKRIYNPIVLFDLWWGSTIFISGFGFYGIYIPSTTTYLIMLAAIISFNIPFIFTLVVNGKKVFDFKPEPDIATDDNLKTLIKYLIGFQVLIIIDLIRHSIRVLQLLASGMHYERIRHEYFYTNHIMSMSDKLISSYMVIPLITFSMIIIALLFLQKPYNKILMITTTLCVGLSAFSSGGRGILLTFGLITLLAYLIQSRQIKTTLVLKLKLLAFLAIVIGFLVYITTARGTSVNSNDILHTVILYFTAPYIYFEKLYKHVLQDNVLLFGGGFFGGIIDFFMLAYKFISGTDFNTMAQNIAKYSQNYVVIGVGVNSKYNAFPTMVYTFFYDFGYLGMILGPLLFGTLAMCSYKKMIISNRLAYKGIYIVIALMIYHSVMKWEGISAVPWIAIGMFLVYGFFDTKGISQLIRLKDEIRKRVRCLKKREIT